MVSKVPSIADIQTLFGPILARSPAQRAILFGSIATGRADEYSDIDLIIVAESSRPFVERFKDYRPVLKAAPTAIQLLVYTPDELARMVAEERGFICRALEEGSVIYERSAEGSGPLG